MTGNNTIVKPLYARLLSFAFLIFLLAVIEFTARLAYREKGNLNQIISLLEQDPELIWRHKPGVKRYFHGAAVAINKDGFRDVDFRHYKNKDKFRIMVFGASPSFGWGIERDRRYSELLKEKFRLNGNIDVDVLNFGVIGYSSYQGLKLIKRKIEKYKPDLITFSYVVNDVDKFRFFRSNGLSDKELVPLSPASVFFKNLISGLFTVKLLRNILVEEKSGYALAGPENKLRVSREDYRKNIEEFISLARNKGIIPVLISMPMYDPYYSGNLEDREKISAKYKQISECLRNVRDYNAVMRELALKNKVILADIRNIYDQYSEAEKKGFFNRPDHDLVHPSKKGHELIADVLYRLLSGIDIAEENKKYRFNNDAG